MAAGYQSIDTMPDAWTLAMTQGTDGSEFFAMYHTPWEFHVRLSGGPEPTEETMGTFVNPRELGKSTLNTGEKVYVRRFKENRALSGQGYFLTQ